LGVGPSGKEKKEQNGSTLTKNGGRGKNQGGYGRPRGRGSNKGVAPFHNKGG